MVRVEPLRRKVLVTASSAQVAYFSTFARYAREHEWHLVPDVTSCGGLPRDWMGDGVLAVVRRQPDLMAELGQSEVPSVVVTDSAESATVPRVTEHHEQIGRLAADHLLDRVYSSFAWAPLIDDRANRNQFAGFRARLDEYDRPCRSLPPAQQWHGGEWLYNWRDYRQLLLAELDTLPRPTAIFAFNDAVAANLIDLCRDYGLAVPEDFAILGVGNDPSVCESVGVPLSSIELDHAQMAYRAAELLDRRMQGAAVPERVLVPPKGVITRVSTDVTAVADPRIARALAYIAENYSNPMLSVLDITAAVGVSRRNLERGFRQVAGYTIREHIVRTRMREASRLLTEHTRTKIADIAGLVGFAGTSNFYRTFRQYYGISPQAHREGTVRLDASTVQLDPATASFAPSALAAATA